MKDETEKESRLKGFLKKFRNKKGLGFAVVAALSSLILLIFPSGTKQEAKEEEHVFSSQEYCEKLEGKAEDLIKELSGVKSCRVVITLKQGFSYVYASDQKVTENFSENGETASKSIEKKTVISENDKKKGPVAAQENMPSVAGVAIVCPGVSYETQYKIISLMSALFDIPSSRISVQS